jgi:Tol biopolymer transport system component
LKRFLSFPLFLIFLSSIVIFTDQAKGRKRQREHKIPPNAIRITTHPSVDRDPVESPDGKLIAFSSNRTENFEIWLLERNGSGARRLTKSGAQNKRPSFSRDGKFIAFQSSKNSETNI